MATIDTFSITSDNNTDKVVHEDSTSYSVGTGATSTQSIDNPYGAKCFITLEWSVDNLNFYPSQAVVDPSNPYTTNGWVDSSSVYFYMENYSGSTQTFYIRYALDTIE